MAVENLTMEVFVMTALHLALVLMTSQRLVVLILLQVKKSGIDIKLIPINSLYIL